MLEETVVPVPLIHYSVLKYYNYSLLDKKKNLLFLILFNVNKP